MLEKSRKEEVPLGNMVLGGSWEDAGWCPEKR